MPGTNKTPGGAGTPHGVTSYRPRTYPSLPPRRELPQRRDDVPTTHDTLREILQALRELNAKFDEFASAHLNARFPYGKPTDRWGRR